MNSQKGKETVWVGTNGGGLARLKRTDGLFSTRVLVFPRVLSGVCSIVQPVRSPLSGSERREMGF
jgi:hypothetical protein